MPLVTPERVCLNFTFVIQRNQDWPVLSQIRPSSQERDASTYPLECQALWLRTGRWGHEETRWTRPRKGRVHQLEPCRCRLKVGLGVSYNRISINIFFITWGSLWCLQWISLHAVSRKYCINKRFLMLRDTNEQQLFRMAHQFVHSIVGGEPRRFWYCSSQARAK